MGKKYASIHLYGEDLEKVIAVIENSYLDNRLELVMEKIFDEAKMKDPERYNMIINHPAYKSLMIPNSILIIKSKAFISIYDEENSFESIQDRVKNLSKNIDYPILFTSNFDDDVFIIGVYKSGKLVTSGNFGTGLSLYDMKQKSINIDKLCNTLSLDKSEALGAINSNNNIDEIERLTEENLHIPLDLDFETIESDSTYIQAYSNKRIRAYNKIKC